MVLSPHRHIDNKILDYPLVPDMFFQNAQSDITCHSAIYNTRQTLGKHLDKRFRMARAAATALFYRDIDFPFFRFRLKYLKNGIGASGNTA